MDVNGVCPLTSLTPLALPCQTTKLRALMNGGQTSIGKLLPESGPREREGKGREGELRPASQPARPQIADHFQTFSTNGFRDFPWEFRWQGSSTVKV